MVKLYLELEVRRLIRENAYLRKRRRIMFCYQCEQTAKGEGCTKIGVCGKRLHLEVKP